MSVESDYRILDRDAIQAAQIQKLRSLMEAVLASNPFYSAKLKKAGVTADIQSLSDFISRVPFTRKKEIVEDQAAHAPYGSNLTYPLDRYTRFNQTSGTAGRPLRWLDTQESWDWMIGCWKRVYQSAQSTPEDRVFFPFSFGPFLGFWVAFEAAARLGCLAISGGGMRSAARVEAILENGVTILCSTPSYAVHLAEVAREAHCDLRSAEVRTIITAGEPGGSVPATRALLERLWPNARVVDHHGMTEIGPVSYECPERTGTLHIIESAFFPEVIHPETQEPIGPGERGELVLTNLGRLGSPLLRYRTGDIVQIAKDARCRCGSSELALDGGILARGDDMVIIRGVNVFPTAVENVLRSCDVAEYRVEVHTERALKELKVQVESEAGVEDSERLTDRVAIALQNALGFRVSVSCVPHGSLPRFEGKAKRWIRS